MIDSTTLPIADLDPFEDNEWLQIAEREIARPIACEILQTCASTRDVLMLGIADLLGHKTDGVAGELALAAWEHCAEKLGWVKGGPFNADLYYEICAEAESLLQCGWFPGEPDALY